MTLSQHVADAQGPNILYRNDGGLQFTNVAQSLAVDGADTGVGVVCSDIDNNGWVDIFTGNRSSHPNWLYMNSGGVFTEMSQQAGITSVGLGMGVMAFDYDNDLDMDLYWTVWPGSIVPLVPNALYENLGSTLFAEVAQESATENTSGWGISCNAADIDLDGWQDFFVTNGFAAITTANVLFHNGRDGTFEDLTAALEGGGLFDGRGAAFADYDGDGDLDLCVTAGPSGQNRLWRNDSRTHNHWLVLELAGSSSNRSAVGARVEVQTAVRTIVKEVSGGAGRGSFNSLPLEFGLGQAESVSMVSVRWPNGFVQRLSDIEVDSYVRVAEADLVGEPVVDFFDLDFLSDEWGSPSSIADLNDDGTVDRIDLTILINNWTMP
jgi:hypothetical protein